MPIPVAALPTEPAPALPGLTGVEPLFPPPALAGGPPIARLLEVEPNDTASGSVSVGRVAGSPGKATLAGAPTFATLPFRSDTSAAASGGGLVTAAVAFGVAGFWRAAFTDGMGETLVAELAPGGWT